MTFVHHRKKKAKTTKKSPAKKSLDKEINKQLKKHGIVKAPQVKHHIAYIDNGPISNTLAGAVATTFTISTTGSPVIPQSLLPFQQGVNYENQFGGTLLGQEILLKKMRLYGRVWETINYLYPNQVVRIIVVEDLQPSQNTTTPTLPLQQNTLLQAYSSTNDYDRLLLWNNDISSIMAVNPNKSYRVLLDKTINLSSMGHVGNVVHFDWTINFKDLKVTYTEQSAGNANLFPTNRDIQCWIMCSSAPAPQPSPTPPIYPPYPPMISIYSDITFTDVV